MKEHEKGVGDTRTDKHRRQQIGHIGIVFKRLSKVGHQCELIACGLKLPALPLASGHVVHTKELRKLELSELKGASDFSNF